jgi:hypothetical protein
MRNSPKVSSTTQQIRLIFRPITGIIIILLPLAHHLDATEVLSIIMAFFVICVIWETVTSLKRGACFWEKWEDTEYPERVKSGESEPKRDEDPSAA